MDLPRLTTDGKANLLLFVVVLFAAFNTGTNLVYLLASTVAALLLVSLLECRRGLQELDLRLDVLPELIEGKTGHVELRLHNRGTRSLRFLRVCLHLESHLGQTLEIGKGEGLRELPPDASERLVLPLHLPMRGTWTVKKIEVESHYPLGLVSWPRRLPPPSGRALALPALLPLRFRGVSAHQQETLTEETRAYERGDGADFYGLRRYVRGDPLKFVHWKSTARAGRLMVLEFQKNLTARYYIFLDLTREKIRGEGANSNLETSVRLCATLCQQLARENCLSQILIVQEDFELSPPVFTAADAPLMFRFLATLPYGSHSQLEDVLERSRPGIIPDSHLVFLLVDLSEATLRQLLRLTRPDQECIAIFNLADEEELTELQEAGRLETLRKAGVRPIFHLRCRKSSIVDLEERMEILAEEPSSA